MVNFSNMNRNHSKKKKCFRQSSFRQASRAILKASINKIFLELTCYSKIYQQITKRFQQNGRHFNIFPFYEKFESEPFPFLNKPFMQSNPSLSRRNLSLPLLLPNQRNSFLPFVNEASPFKYGGRVRTLHSLVLFIVTLVLISAGDNKK